MDTVKPDEKLKGDVIGRTAAILEVTKIKTAIEQALVEGVQMIFLYSADLTKNVFEFVLISLV